MVETNQLEIDILGKTGLVVFPSYQIATSGTVEMLSHVAQAYTGAYTRDWLVSDMARKNYGYCMKLGVPQVIQDSGQEVLTAFISGVHGLETPSPSPPDYFTPPALHAIRKVLSLYQDGVAQLRFRTSTDEVAPTKRAAENAKILLEGGRARWTTMRGRLARVFVPDQAKTIRIQIEERLTRKKIACIVSNDLIGDVGNSLGKDVAVSGMCTYLKTGEPVKIKVTKLRRLSPISLADMPPLKLTDDDHDDAEFIRRLRDAE